MSAGESLRELRERKPLVHQITNYVVMNETANATLALGALPVMAHAPEEVEEMVALAGALVLNIGTLSSHWVEAMLAAGRAANAARRPGRARPGRRRRDALPHRHGAADPRRGRRGRPARQRGRDRDASSASTAEVRGVESIAVGGEPADLAREAARSLGVVASVTGPVDHVSDGERVASDRERRPDARGDHRHRLHVERASRAASSPSPAHRSTRRSRRSSPSASPARTRRTRREGPARSTSNLYDALAALDPGTLDARARVA